MNLRDAGVLVKDAGLKFIKDKASRLGAALAFYTALSLSPLLLVCIGIAGLVFGADAARGEIEHQIKGLVGDEGATAIQSMLAKSSDPGHGTVATVVGIVTLLVGAVGVFSQLQGALNTVWKVEGKEAKEDAGIWATVMEYVLSFSLVGGLAFLLLVSLVATAAMSGLGGVVGQWLPGWETALGVANALLSYALVVVLFALIFKVLPNVKMSWSDVWLGAAVTGGLFVLGKFLIGLYLGKSAPGSTYGAAGAFVVLLLWIYYSTQIVLFGACLTFLYASRFGSGVRAADGSTVKGANPGVQPATAPAH